METLTIFTPAYNRAKFLPRAFEALKRQTLKDFIWMIIDDGSTDNTEEVVEASNELNDIDNIETQNESNEITEDDTEDVVEIKDEDNESWSE